MLVLVLASVAALIAFLAPKAMTAREQLISSIPLVSEIQASVIGGDTETATAKAALLVDKTSEAREATSGRVWRALEAVPWAGSNLQAVRLASEVAHTLAVEAVSPVSSVAINSLNPKNGAIDLDSVNAILDDIESVTIALEHAETTMSGIEREPLIDQVEAGVAQMDEALKEASDTLGSIRPLLDALPGMLGADGPREVLILFQNNGEVMPGGGTIGSLAQVTIDHGAITITAQSSASVRDIPHYDEPVVNVPADARSVYGRLLGRYIQSVTRTPRFDLSYDIAREFWERKTGVTTDAVIALDTIGIATLLRVTGPVELAGGITITSENAPSLLLGDLYLSHSPEEVDLINQSFAEAMMKRMFSGQVSVPEILGVVSTVAAEGRIRIWSDRAVEQALIAHSPFDHRNPVSSHGDLGLGVYFLDATPGKMQRFMTQSIVISNETCTRPRKVRVAVTLGNTVSANEVSRLPDYVLGSGRTTPPGAMRVSALVYTGDSWAFAGAALDDEPSVQRSGTDGAYSVSEIQALLRPGETRTMTFEYETSNLDSPVYAEVTPTATPTQVTSAPACSNVSAGPAGTP